MKSENKLNCPLYSNLIICLLAFNFLYSNNSQDIIELKGGENTLKPIYEIKSEDIKPVISNLTSVVVTQKEVQTQKAVYNYVKPSYNSVTGANLVNYAKNYLGLPYVSNGNSLTTGTDCSGFTKLIYQEFGLSLGRTVASQIYSGTYVAKNDLQPGDLVFYGNNSSYASHVGIYIGSGLIIHESNPRDGVKISSVNIMVYITARRLITENVVSQVEEVKNDEVKPIEDVLPKEENETENEKIDMEIKDDIINEEKTDDIILEDNDISIDNTNDNNIQVSETEENNILEEVSTIEENENNQELVSEIPTKDE